MIYFGVGGWVGLSVVLDEEFRFAEFIMPIRHASIICIALPNYRRTEFPVKSPGTHRCNFIDKSQTLRSVKRPYEKTSSG